MSKISEEIKAWLNKATPGLFKAKLGDLISDLDCRIDNIEAGVIIAATATESGAVKASAAPSATAALAVVSTATDLPTLLAAHNALVTDYNALRADHLDFVAKLVAAGSVV
jgi:hypothetical protein